MKRKELLKKINSLGCELVRHGSRHDLYIILKQVKNSPFPDTMK